MLRLLRSLTLSRQRQDRPTVSAFSVLANQRRAFGNPSLAEMLCKGTQCRCTCACGKCGK